MAPFKFIDRVFNGLEIQQYGDGSTSRDYTFIGDIADGVIRSVPQPSLSQTNLTEPNLTFFFVGKNSSTDYHHLSISIQLI